MKSHLVTHLLLSSAIQRVSSTSAGNAFPLLTILNLPEVHGIGEYSNYILPVIDLEALFVSSIMKPNNNTATLHLKEKHLETFWMRMDVVPVLEIYVTGFNYILVRNIYISDEGIIETSQIHILHCNNIHSHIELFYICRNEHCSEYFSTYKIQHSDL